MARRALLIPFCLAVLAAAPQGASAFTVLPNVNDDATNGLVISTPSSSTGDDTMSVAFLTENSTVSYVITSHRAMNFTNNCSTLSADPANGDQRLKCPRLKAVVRGTFSGTGKVTFGPKGAFTDPMTLTGGPNADHLTGGAANDTISAGGGNDSASGGGGSDTVNGDAGNDSVDGGSGSDTVNGGSGTDFVTDGIAIDTGNDTLDGGPGDDKVEAGIGADTLRGGDGDDTLENLLAPGTGDSIDGGSGIDTAQWDGTSGTTQTWSISGSTATGPNQVHADNVETLQLGREKDTVSYATPSQTAGILNVDGGSGDDTITGSAARNVLTGGEGRDTLNGLGGDDIIDARTGDAPDPTAHDDVADCGAGTADLAILDLADPAPVGCDGNVDRSAIGERANVVLGVARPLAVRGGKVRVRVSCPRAVNHGCKGTLALARSEKALTGAPTTSYSVRRGRSALVAVTPRAGTKLHGHRVEVRSLERGDVKGRKTTLRTARVA